MGTSNWQGNWDRKGEIGRLEWTDIDFEGHIIRVNSPEKGSLPRSFNVSTNLIKMIDRLPRKSGRIFNNIDILARCFYNQRKRTAQKLGNPRLKRMGSYTFRHWFGTLLYHKNQRFTLREAETRHKYVQNTLIYINLEQTYYGNNMDEYHVKVIRSLEEAVKLAQAGFEYFDEIDGAKICRKRK